MLVATRYTWLVSFAKGNNNTSATRLGENLKLTLLFFDKLSFEGCQIALFCLDSCSYALFFWGTW